MFYAFSVRCQRDFSSGSSISCRSVSSLLRQTVSKALLMSIV